MKYDDASWHSGGEYPSDLPSEAAGTHTGMFLAWAILAGLGGEIHTTECPEDLESLQARTETPGRFFLRVCDGKFADEDLNQTGNDFTGAYFDFAEGQYLSDYEALFAAELESLYHVADTWENFDKIKPVLDQRFRTWSVGTLHLVGAQP